MANDLFYNNTTIPYGTSYLYLIIDSCTDVLLLLLCRTFFVLAFPVYPTYDESSTALETAVCEKNINSLYMRARNFFQFFQHCSHSL